ncbi:acyl-CoA N-acyltransferase [Xylariales sp. PMI_506]|nr:acyl-CoA N-acyltransferase [Xylariales sp. PMI_506]
MATYTLSRCTVADALDLSRNNMSAFWQEPNWVLAWKHTTLEQHIITTARRYPRRLMSSRETTRHQKAIDPETGHVVGYIRWELPAGHTTTVDGELAWPEAIVPDVDPEKKAELLRIAADTPWNPNNETDPLDEKVDNIKKEIMARKPYICLDYLAVHPDYQGKGIATALVQNGMKNVEELGLDIFVLACRSAWGVYGRLGFRIEQELVQDDTMYGGPGEYGVRYMIYEQTTKPSV